MSDAAPITNWLSAVKPMPATVLPISSGASRVCWPGWLEWLLAIVLFDLRLYVWHVLNHKVPLLWRFHAVHHADRELDVRSGARLHTGEIVLSSAARLAVLPLLDMTMPNYYSTRSCFSP